MRMMRMRVRVKMKNEDDDPLPAGNLLSGDQGGIKPGPARGGGEGDKYQKHKNELKRTGHPARRQQLLMLESLRIHTSLQEPQQAAALSQFPPQRHQTCSCNML